MPPGRFRADANGFCTESRDGWPLAGPMSAIPSVPCGRILASAPFQNGVVRSVSWSAGRCFAIQLSKIKLEVPLAPRRGWGGLVSSEFRVSGSGVWVLRSQLTTSQSHTLYIVPPEVHLGKRQKRISRKPVRAKRVFHPRTPVGVKVKGDGKARSP